MNQTNSPLARRSGVSRRTLVAGSAALIIALVGCGSDDDDSMTEQGFLDRSNEICVAGDQEIDEAVSVIFGASEPTPAQLQEVLDTIVTTSNRIVDDIDALGAPASLAGDVDALLAEWRSANGVAESQGLGFFERDDDPWEKLEGMARDIGLDVCADS